MPNILTRKLNGVRKIKYTRAITIGAIMAPSISPNFIHILLNGDSNFEFLRSTPWRQKELLAEEFKSIGFYISNHPLNEYESIFSQLNIISFEEFYKNDLKSKLSNDLHLTSYSQKCFGGNPVDGLPPNIHYINLLIKLTMLRSTLLRPSIKGALRPRRPICINL